MNIDVKRRREKRNSVLRWILYFLLIALDYIRMSTIPTSFPTPLCLVTIALSISVFEDPFDSALTGCVAGLFLDSAEGTLIGLNGIIVMWCCLMTSLLFYFVMRRHIVNVVLLVTAAATVQTVFRYLFYYAIWGYDSSGTLFVHEFIPIIVTTVITVPIFYPIIKFLHKKLGRISENYIEEKSEDIVRE